MGSTERDAKRTLGTVTAATHSGAEEADLLRLLLIKGMPYPQHRG